MHRQQSPPPFEVKVTQLWRGNLVRPRRKGIADLLQQRDCAVFSKPRVWIGRGQWLLVAEGSLG